MAPILSDRSRSAQSLKDIIQVTSHVSIPADRHLIIGQDVVPSSPKTPVSSLSIISYKSCGPDSTSGAFRSASTSANNPCRSSRLVNIAT